MENKVLLLGICGSPRIEFHVPVSPEHGSRRKVRGTLRGSVYFLITSSEVLSKIYS